MNSFRTHWHIPWVEVEVDGVTILKFVKNFDLKKSKKSLPSTPKVELCGPEYPAWLFAPDAVVTAWLAGKMIAPDEVVAVWLACEPIAADEFY